MKPPCRATRRRFSRGRRRARHASPGARLATDPRPRSARRSRGRHRDRVDPAEPVQQQRFRLREEEASLTAAPPRYEQRCA